MKIKLIIVLGLVLSSCWGKSQDYKVIAKVPEASGICYASSSDTLFVANDEGKVYELSREGKRVRKLKLGKYDLEGVACDKDKLYFAIEKKERILVVEQKSLNILNNVKIVRKYDGKVVIKKDNDSGIEGITMINGTLYLSNQSNRTYPNKDASIVFAVDSIKKKKTKITSIINHGFVDIAGLSYYQDSLYMVSDKKNLLIQYDIAKQKTIATHKLPKFSQEGITFDNQGFVYFADDEGRVLKVESKRFE